MYYRFATTLSIAVFCAQISSTVAPTALLTSISWEARPDALSTIFSASAGSLARPDLATAYSNLFWCCRECNENKGDSWPSPEQSSRGQRFLNACNPEDDHDLHWKVQPDGTLDPKTAAGEFTIERLKLWRPQLTHHRARLIQFRAALQQINELLNDRDLAQKDRVALEQRVAELEGWLAPPVFNRPRGPHPHR